MASNLPEDPMAYQLTITPRFATIVNDYGDKYSGQNEQARSLGEFPVFDAKFKLEREIVNKAQMQNIWDHYMECRGRAGRFYFYDYWVAMTHRQAWTLCGIGDGSKVLFDIPGRSTSAHTIYVDGLSVSVSQYYTGGGVADNDRAELSAAPLAGAVVTADFYGYRCMYGRYSKDNLDRDTYFDWAFDMGIKIKGLPWPV